MINFAKNMNNNMTSTDLKQAVQTIKTAILQSQSRAVRMWAARNCHYTLAWGFMYLLILAEELGEQEPLMP